MAKLSAAIKYGLRKLKKRARSKTRAQHRPFTEYDIEKSQSAASRYKEIGATGVPVILFGDKRMNGFSESGFERIYEKHE